MNIQINGLRPDPAAPGPAAPGLAVHDPFEGDVIALRPGLTAFARRLHRQESDAEDLVQETMMKALRSRHRFQPGTNLKAWLFTIMRNTFNTRYRVSRREAPCDPATLEAFAVCPSTQAVDLWTREAINRLLNDLSPAHREVLILIPVLGLNYEDTAEVCGCSIGTVKSRLNRARHALSTLLDGGPA